MFVRFLYVQLKNFSVCQVGPSIEFCFVGYKIKRWQDVIRVSRKKKGNYKSYSEKGEIRCKTYKKKK